MVQNKMALLCVLVSSHLYLTQPTAIPQKKSYTLFHVSGNFLPHDLEIEEDSYITAH